MQVAGYVTLENLMAYLTRESQQRQPFQPATLRRFILQASNRLDRECKRTFFPRKETRNYDHPRAKQADRRFTGSTAFNPSQYAINIFYASELQLDDDLLEVLSLIHI